MGRAYSHGGRGILVLPIPSRAAKWCRPLPWKIRRSLLKLVIAVVRPDKLNDVLESLFRADVRGLTLQRVQGHGGETERVETYRGTTVKMELSEKARIEIAVSDHFVDRTVDAILRAARTGAVGDGKVFVLPVEKCTDPTAKRTAAATRSKHVGFGCSLRFASPRCPRSRRGPLPPRSGDFLSGERMAGARPTTADSPAVNASPVTPELANLTSPAVRSESVVAMRRLSRGGPPRLAHATPPGSGPPALL